MNNNSSKKPGQAWNEKGAKRPLAPSSAGVPIEPVGQAVSRGKIYAYATRKVGQDWPGPVWSQRPDGLAVPPNYELVRVCIEPVHGPQGSPA